MWTVKTKAITSNNKGNWNDLKIFQTTPEQSTWNERNQGTTGNSHIGHCIHTAESKDVKYIVLLSIYQLNISFPGNKNNYRKEQIIENCI